MPRISVFYGIVIEMYYGDHSPPHFHARYGDDHAKVAIGEATIIAGSLPKPALRLVRQWARMHREELQSNWDRVGRHQKPRAIDPLR